MEAGAPTWLPDAAISRLASFGAAPALIAVRENAIQSLSYSALAEKVRSLAVGLADVGIKPGDPVALIAPNGIAWVIARLSLGLAGAVVIALDDLSTASDLTGALTDSGCRHVIASAAHAATVHAIDPSLLVVALADGVASEGTRSSQSLFVEPSATTQSRSFDAPALLTYTSGTTGAPKSFLLTYGNLWANLQPLATAGLVGIGDRVLLPLPLHHIYPFLVGLVTPLCVGAAVVFPEAISGPALLEAIRVADVSAIVGVPRLYAALASGFEARIVARGWFVRGLFRALLGAAIGLRRRFGIDAGRWAFRHLRAQIGPRLRLLVSGGAALDRETLWPLVGLGFEVRSGYGLAETASIFTGNLPGAERFESEGKPFQGGTMRIAGPDESGIGEIEVKGPNLFTSYRSAEATRDAFTADGWFRTGDLGRIDEEGFLYVAGRRKETIVLGGGKKVNPETLERVYGSSPFIREIAVLERQGSLVGLVRPDVDAIRRGPSARIDDTIRVTLASRSQSLPTYERLAGFALAREPLPRTRFGKYRRFLLPALYEQSLLPEPTVPTSVPSAEDTALLAAPGACAMYEFLIARYPAAKRSLDANLQLDLAIDSLEWVSLSLAWEQVGGRLSERVFAEAATVRDLLNAAAQSAKAAPESSREEDEAVLRRWLAPTSGPLRLFGFILFVLDWILVRALFRFRVEGAENLPEKGPYALVANHASDLDAPAIIAALGFRRAQRLYWTGDATRLFQRHWLAALWRALHVFPADERLPSRTLAGGEAILARGDNLAWFPEGWRTPDGRLQRFLPGIGRILAKTGVPAVPIYISGTFEALPRSRHLPRLRAIRVAFGVPVMPRRDASDQQIADMLYQAVAALERSRVRC